LSSSVRERVACHVWAKVFSRLGVARECEGVRGKVESKKES
jgi:hypothetical protein